MARYKMETSHIGNRIFTYLSKESVVSNFILLVKSHIGHLYFWDLTSVRSNIPLLIFIFFMISFFD